MGMRPKHGQAMGLLFVPHSSVAPKFWTVSGRAMLELGNSISVRIV